MKALNPESFCNVPWPGKMAATKMKGGAMHLRDILKQQKGLYQKHSGWSVQKGLGESSFHKSQTTFIDSENTPVTVETDTVHTLECGHAVGGIQELLGRCQLCDNWICVRCGQNARCKRCSKLLCPSCIKPLDNEPYCLGCRRVTLIKRGSLYLLRRCHEELSK